jgi:hypothetical protein
LVRLAHARSFLDVAELVYNDDNREEYGNAVASLAVLAGIAASDAACCAALGQRSRSEDHHDAENLLREVRGAGQAANDLRRLLNLKDQAHYGVIHVNAADLRATLRHAKHLVDFADGIVRS